MTNLTITIPAIAKDAVVSSIKAQAWEIARKAVVSADLAKTDFWAGTIEAPDMASVAMQIDALMDAAAEIDGIATRGDWTQGMISQIEADIGEAKEQLTHADWELSRCAPDTEAWAEAMSTKGRASNKLIRLTSI